MTNMLGDMAETSVTDFFTLPKQETQLMLTNRATSLEVTQGRHQT